MNFRYLGSTGVKVSVACMGTMTFGREIGEPDSHAILDRYAASGGTFLDTADNIYSDGASEEILGRWLQKQGSRDQWVLATKVAFPTGPAESSVGLSRKHILEAIDASLKRLQTDYVDLYQIHWWDYGTPIEETMRALNDLVTSGKVRYIGCSNFAAWHIVQALSVSDANGWARLATLQPMYGLLTREADIELLPVCEREGLGIMTYSPLSRGQVTGKHKPEAITLPASPAGLAQLSEADWSTLRNAYESERRQRVIEAVRRVAESNGTTSARVALAWAAQRKCVAALVLGARTVEQLEDNLGFVDLTLSPEDIKTLDDISQPNTPYPHEYLGWANSEYKRW